MEEYASYNEFRWRFLKELRDSHQKVPFISPSPTSASHFLPEDCSHSYDKVKEESQHLDPIEAEVLQREDWLQYPLADAKQETNLIVSQRFTEDQHLKDPLVSVATVTPDAKTTCWSDHIADRRSIKKKKKKKRMIKNRESAARSRAKKQAYVKRLEQMVLELRAIKTQLMKRNEVESSLHFSPSVEPKYKLRRISSSLF
ncbi:uncharacterized protein [Typha angustifolia]|uniref:uncharacterized protein n=1 Tax=Typha angustifolia TaxID=59011 RepID=UPI003C2EF399